MSADISVRPAAKDEQDALGALKLRSSLAWGDLVDELMALPEAAQLAAELLPVCFVAEIDGRVAGFATLVQQDAAEAELEDLFVEPSEWRKGVGRRLVDEAVRRARALGAHSLLVVANRRAQPFYEACGFTVSGMVMTRFEPAPRMCLNLRGPERS
ncbi:MAG TPA: GNAT family N-acetyltransferase [Caulobacteraceae bacterium]|jgi:GNAT superfamily N-acetyltransferase